MIEFKGKSLRRACLTGAHRLAKVLRSVQPDIVHSHTDHPDLVVGLASRRTPINVARTIHNDGIWPTHRWTGRIAESAFGNELAVCISKATQRAYAELRGRYGLDRSPHEMYIPNGVPFYEGTDRLDRAAVARAVGADAGRLLLCFAGRLTYQKGFDVLLSAMERLPASFLDRLELHVFGQGEQLDGYVARVQAGRLPVHFHRPVHGVSQMFSGFDAVVMPSRYEGLPLVAIESLAAGVPLIATTAPGLDEVLPSQWPLAVPPDDPKALVDVLIRLVDNRVDTEELTRRGAARARDRYGLERMVCAYEEAYCTYLERRDAAPDQLWKT